MKIKSLVVLALVAFFGLALSPTASAGWNRGYCGSGWGGGNWGYGGYGYRGWGGGGGYCGPRYGGWGGGSFFGISIAAPAPVYYAPAYYPRTVVVERAYSGYPVYQSGYSHSLVATAQARLARMGYYRAGIDGDFGPQTSRAISNYQVDNGLPVTGRLDSRTRSSLGV